MVSKNISHLDAPDKKMNLSDISALSSQHELDEGLEYIPVNEVRREFLNTVFAFHKTLKLSASYLGIALGALLILFFYLKFDLKVLQGWLTAIFVILALAQASTLANTILTLLTLIHGKLNHTLKVNTEITADHKSMRGDMLFAKSLADGSIVATRILYVAVIIATMFITIRLPNNTGADSVLDKLAIIVACYVVFNIASLLTIKLTKKRIDKTLQMLQEHQEGDLTNPAC